MLCQREADLTSLQKGLPAHDRMAGLETGGAAYRPPLQHSNGLSNHRDVRGHQALFPGLNQPAAWVRIGWLESRLKNRLIIPIAALTACLLLGLSVGLRRQRADDVARRESLKAVSLLAYQGNSNALAQMETLGTNALPELLRLLQTHDSFLRRQTWTHLPRLPTYWRQQIARRYSPPQAEATREAAARALGRLGPDASAAIPALTQALRDNQGRVRWEASSALGRIGKAAVLPLITTLEADDARARQAAAAALGQMGPDAADAIPALVGRLADPDQAVRNSAAYTLVTVGAPGVLALLATLEEGREPARTVAARALTNSYLPHFRVASELYAMTRDESPARRKRSLEALRAIRVASGLATQAALARIQDPVAEVRMAAIETLSRLPEPDETVVRALTAALRDEAAGIRAAAATALGGWGSSARLALPELTRRATDQDPSVSEAAAKARQQILQGSPTLSDEPGP